MVHTISFIIAVVITFIPACYCARFQQWGQSKQGVWEDPADAVALWSLRCHCGEGSCQARGWETHQTSVRTEWSGVIDNFCIALCSDVHKHTALYNILQHYVNQVRKKIEGNMFMKVILIWQQISMTTHYCESCFVILCSETERLMLLSLTVDNFLALKFEEKKKEDLCCTRHVSCNCVTPTFTIVNCFAHHRDHCLCSDLVEMHGQLPVIVLTPDRYLGQTGFRVWFQLSEKYTEFTTCCGYSVPKMIESTRLRLCQILGCCNVPTMYRFRQHVFHVSVVCLLCFNCDSCRVTVMAWTKKYILGARNLIM